jgi:hypothetical protein
MNDTTYFLSKDCFVCKMGCYWIILSAKRDRYLCVAHAELASIGDQLHGWWTGGDSVHPSAIDAGTDKLVESLTNNGIITRNPIIGKPFAESQYPAPDNRIEAPESASEPVSVSRILRFLLACAKVDWQLRTQALSGTLAKIERRRPRGESSSSATCNAPYTGTLVAAFQKLRPLYPRSYLCLFDSLALLEFLAGYHILPRVVFGVVADPFQAHCWLQAGSTVINDELERVGRYKPILSV